MIHPLADVKTNYIGEGTMIWQFSIVCEGAKIGKHCNINCHSFIEGKVLIGNNVTIKSGVYLWNEMTIGNNVFIGPGAIFTNDKYPRSKAFLDKNDPIYIDDYASIGAGAIILGNVKIGKYAMVAAGSLVTKNIPERALVKGRPAKIVKWLNKSGTPMTEVTENIWLGEDGKYKVENDSLIKL